VLFVADHQNCLKKRIKGFSIKGGYFKNDTGLVLAGSLALAGSVDKIIVTSYGF